MKSELPKILVENGLDPFEYDLQELYEIGRKNIINNIEFYYDKDYSCKSVLRSLFTDGILEFIRSKGRSKLEILVEEKTKIIHDENKRISQKHKEITQSIEYARSLQNSILPSISKIENHLKNYFLFYKPKDIIGGDFFWFETFENYIFFAVADCTGHGVPGGMVSLVCSNALNKCVNELKIIKTSEILNMSRHLIIETFNKNGQNINDGMDIILCKYDTISNKLEFSGANRPLWILRNNSKNIEEFKTDRQPVGKFFEPKPFNTFETQIEKKDIVYMFSDGYIDQFGGDNDSKFKTSRFKDLINKIKYLQIKEQENILKFNFESWKNNTEQTDDICVWGIML